jgi:hypothetical protein
VCQEQQDHQRHRDDNFDEGGPQIPDCAPDQVRAIVNRHNPDALRQPRLDLLQPRLYAIDDIQRILALAHDHNPRNRIAAARRWDALPDLR